MSDNGTRRDAIAAVIIYHGTQAGGTCHCGHVYRPGDSIAEHKADAIEAGIALHAAGMSPEQIPDAVKLILKLAK